ncbi:MAG: permease-like cell division protein FtsX [Gammaproteobacteria bacterium]
MSRSGDVKSRLRAWFAEHARACVGTVGEFARAPLSTLLTVAVLAIALALPAAALKVIDNLGAATRTLDTQARITLYLREDVDETAAGSMAALLRDRPGVEAATVISRAQGAADFRRWSGYGEALDLLEENPLPVAVLITAARGTDAAAMDALFAHVRGLAEVEMAQMDRQWVERLQALTRAARRAVAIVAALLGAAVLLVVGNTIRLGISGRTEEIEIARLFGATDAFVRRPFLYHGLLLGVTAAVLAAITVAGALAALTGPVTELAVSYGSPFRLVGMGAADTAALMLAGGLLGLAGSWLAVGRHLRAVAEGQPPA